MHPRQSLSPVQLADFLNQPALQPPHGVTPNFDNPPHDNKLAITVIALCVAVSTILSLLRVYTRVSCMKRVFFIAGTWILTTIAGDMGFFVHFWNVRVGDVEGFIYDYVIASILWCFTLIFVKAAIILEWSHIFIPKSTHNTFFWICHCMIIANSALYIATVIAINFACTPRERIWRRWIPGSCINTDAFNIFIATFHLAFSLAMLLIPQRIIWKLLLTTRQKIGISFVFSVGVIACACAAGRLVTAVKMSSTEDITYAYSRHLLCGVGESTAAIVVFCVPAIPIAFRPAGPISRLKTKMRLLLGQHDRPSKIRRHSWPRTARESALVCEYRCMNEDSAEHLTELEHGTTPNCNVESQREENPIYSYMGILRTTEIEITTYRNTQLGTLSRQQEERRLPWLENQVTRMR
ncbi:hypothetical protein F4779DRAFT_627000 [Xylariaceae sp. FL0662B]|nr:hypothetical protein F4779DRAFT_627000 [Xylariaceae sp. FL0662B]